MGSGVSTAQCLVAEGTRCPGKLRLWQPWVPRAAAAPCLPLCPNPPFSLPPPTAFSLCALASSVTGCAPQVLSVQTCRPLAGLTGRRPPETSPFAPAGL